ncbi:MAG: flagellar hook-length control protein FliK [Deltaproteobacteria bacterium]|nr:MAG: flagellar hook-length control protein FliK [Deltaproteobacteria bacterium]
MTDRVDEARRDYNREVTRSRNDVRNTSSDKNTQQKSAFDKVMEDRQFTLNNNPSLNKNNTTATREAVKPAASQQEKFGKEKEGFQKKLEEKDKDGDEKKLTSSRSDGAARARQAEKKVVSKEHSEGREEQQKGQGNSEQGGGGGGQGSHGSRDSHGGAESGMNQQSRRQRNFQTTKSQANTPEAKTQRSDKSTFHIDMPHTTTGNSAPDVKNAQLPRTLNKAVLDQVVQYARVMTKTDGDKEMELQLKEDVFKGLRLRVRMKDGKVMATFITHSESVRNLFQSQKAEISKALEEKGIVVSSLNVIFS